MTGLYFKQTAQFMTRNKKVKKQAASSPHVDGKYHPPLLDVAVL